MEMIKQYFDELLADSSPEKSVWNQEAILEKKKPHWSYIDGCVLIAVQRMYNVTGEKQYIDFLKKFIDYFINEEGEILGYSLESMNSDSINEGKVLFDLYDQTGEEKYRKALDRLYGQLEKQPRTESGSFWHKLIYPNQIWLDGLNMVQPFYLAYGLRWLAGNNLSDVLIQFRNVQKYMKDQQTGLLYHGYDESKKMFWSDQKTGCSKSFWSRSIGWYAMGLIDTIELLQTTCSEAAEELSVYLVELINSIMVYQDQESKLFYQVTDQADRLGNYLETSASCAIAYILIKGVRLGIIDQSYVEKGGEILREVMNQKMVQENGRIKLKDICLVAGLGGMPGKGEYHERDGTYEYYISEPVVSDDGKGIGPLIYAYSEYMEATVDSLFE
ncbi:glycoside hydrolase family 88 protein [Enterococcus sp. BWB1-3]|uniref:glycoside hydrolase family 88/105 protein n=1 Tax=unclassified Enterococcus TaxID=2608891 RepID=UPI0019219ACD|nr:MULTISPECIES: glycoside hydrolase family 88 protein [unclassified Enterococcus]MBL1230198.1 glycoside hydrolase family 88 protein [Enterococcus sp. BWB1-3]MCB5953199.1 glycoside hydrolase family 88 protein [Enterococcus sp. BWT-B8]MCB5953759.1 glycoside hydrolase family 88 protein [Enterococcus sp. CWB-B31]